VVVALNQPIHGTRNEDSFAAAGLHSAVPDEASLLIVDIFQVFVTLWTACEEPSCSACLG
jgi:hypothetical protein